MNPRVSIGMPVFNGERHLAQALESLLGQTFGDFELLISDNASTDGTEALCRHYEGLDARISYTRRLTNSGAAPNFNATFQRSRAPYFKWAAHDDVCAPDFLVRCTAALESDPSVVLCYTRQIDIDDEGRVIGPNPYGLDASSARPEDRFEQIIRFWRGAPAVWGVIRSDVLRKTKLIQRSYASDLVLLAELVLHGRFLEVPDDLLFHREHRGRSVYLLGRHEFLAWLDPRRSTAFALPTLEWFLGYLGAIARAPLTPAERRRCVWKAATWLRWRWRYALADVADTARRAYRGRLPATR